jgi:hypothetical protein
MNRRDLYSVILRLSKKFNWEAVAEFLDLIRDLTEEENKELEENGINLGGFTFWRRGQTFFWQKNWNKSVRQKLRKAMEKGQEINEFDVPPRFYLAYREESLISLKKSRRLLETDICYITEFGRMVLTTQTSTWSTAVLFSPRSVYYSGGPRVPDYRFFSIPNREFYLTVATLSFLGLSVLAAVALIFS